MTNHASGTTRWFAAAIVAALGLAVGCSSRDIDSKYGRRSGKSVNGTGALAALFRAHGFRVSTWKRFSPRLEQADVLVWVNDDYSPPTPEQRQFVERWLSNGFNRTLIYVGRDYDAAMEYYRWLGERDDSADWQEIARRDARATTAFQRDRTETTKQYARWFVVNPTEYRYRPTSFTGPWAEGIDADTAALELQTRLDPPTASDIVNKAAPTPTGPTSVPTTVKSRPVGGGPRRPPRTLPIVTDEPIAENPGLVNGEPLLVTDRGDPFVVKITQETASYPWPQWNDGQIITVANGSFLLNLPLVNHEHRKLASRLIDECGDHGQVMFLESGTNGLPVMLHEVDEGRTGFSLFRVWPLNVVLVHVVVLGLLYCLARSPIFGRPRTLPTGAYSDFSRHIAAVGQLLEGTGNTAYARQLIANYHAVKAKDTR